MREQYATIGIILYYAILVTGWTGDILLQIELLVVNRLHNKAD